MRRAGRPDAVTPSIESKGFAGAGVSDGGFVRADGMRVVAMRAPQRELQRAETGQRVRGGLNLGRHLTMGGGTTIHEHGTISPDCSINNSGPGPRVPDDAALCLGITWTLHELVHSNFYARRRARFRASVRRAHYRLAALAARFARQRGVRAAKSPDWRPPRSTRIGWRHFASVISHRMGLQRQLARVAAAIVLIAGAAVPSLAFAHEGHAHHPHAAKAAPASPDVRAHPQTAAPSATALTATRDSANAALGGVTSCGSNCCSGSAGMACCGAALVPESFWIPLLRVSAQLGIPRAPPLPGLPPEALPKPPKSVA
jgi:hypothetical protein